MDDLGRAKNISALGLVTQTVEFFRMLAEISRLANRPDFPSSSSIRRREFCLASLYPVRGAPNFTRGAATATNISGIGSSTLPPDRPEPIIV